MTKAKTETMTADVLPSPQTGDAYLLVCQDKHGKTYFRIFAKEDDANAWGDFMRKKPLGIVTVAIFVGDFR